MVEGKFYPEEAEVRTPATLKSEDMTIMGFDDDDQPLITNYSDIRDAAFSDTSQIPVWKTREAAGVTFLGSGPPDDPTTTEIFDGTGTGTGILSKGYALGNSASGSFPLGLDYKEGSDIYFYLEWTGNDAPAVGATAKFQVDYTVSRKDTVISAPLIITAEVAYPAQYTEVRAITAAIPGATFLKGDSILVKFSRVAATTTEYIGVCIIIEGGLIYQSNENGTLDTPPLPSS